jgi:hypothetical protein
MANSAICKQLHTMFFMHCAFLVPDVNSGAFMHVSGAKQFLAID